VTARSRSADVGGGPPPEERSASRPAKTPTATTAPGMTQVNDLRSMFVGSNGRLGQFQVRFKRITAVRVPGRKLGRASHARLYVAPLRQRASPAALPQASVLTCSLNAADGVAKTPDDEADADKEVDPAIDAYLSRPLPASEPPILKLDGVTCVGLAVNDDDHTYRDEGKPQE
jgi:hypothetical protein